MTNKPRFCAYAALLISAGLAAAPVSAEAQPGASAFTTLYHFTQSQNGEGLVEGALTAFDGVLYGAASQGGSAGKGTVFAFDLANLTETTLFSFTGGKNRAPRRSGPWRMSARRSTDRRPKVTGPGRAVTATIPAMARSGA